VTQTAPNWGWAGSAREFLDTPPERVFTSLDAHLQRLLHCSASQDQRQAWIDEHRAITDALAACAQSDTSALDWSVVFEYELPLEGGRRPDVVVHAGDALVVLEFKAGVLQRPADVDQVRAYARDLADYHKASHGRPITPMLVLTGAQGWAVALDDDTIATSPDGIAHYLHEAATGSTPPLDDWLDSPYEPLPTLVAAAKRIFRDEPLPHVRAALSAGIPEALDYLLAVCRSAEEAAGRALAFVTGVPGSGKTLLGLRLVHEGSTSEGKATFLSGNGPLVEVLQYALQSRVFVRDLHKAILDYGVKGKVPREHIIVFDEAQRAWDRERVSAKRKVDASEPELLIRAGERVESWATLVGLVGEGQEIYAGEEAGIDQWADALDPPNASAGWVVHCAPKLAPHFERHAIHTADVLDLTVSLRSRRAARLHEWVALLLDGDLGRAARLAAPLHAEGFPMYVTRSLDEARRFAAELYDEHPDARYGIVASSHDDKTLPAHGVPNDFQSTKRVKYGPWYEAPRDDPRSCCALREVVTEFGCQGLELDLPIVAWGRDMTWTGQQWELRPKRRRDPVHEPHQLLRNTYRVLLTRGRDGFVVFLPPIAELDLTEHALLAAGIRPLPEPVLATPRLANTNGAA
jgi:hypothetical protein